jgi:hypothetical protein
MEENNSSCGAWELCDYKEAQILERAFMGGVGKKLDN